ncbi:DUF5672 family protein [Piscinibacter sp. HJYY11]|uniref:DUF5672 family protein n=1 Tax=Piscinibacter sp. HJYY11 TaxID=2801333 RepID=UPI00191F5301|nr:DUF5672 family protein [Piscinibacter sp. HJYY11]MBL0730294.1 hypothetical protein [Piscinibacter sp. HJYY11]
MKRPSPAPTVCVVIPCYQAQLRPFEEVSLAQCRKVLAAHDTVLVKPGSLDLSDICSRFGITRTESFDDAYFRGIAGYNRLMLSDDFYARFAEYDYILIHQLDAFVFRDELGQWCQADYDYVGAPWLPVPGVPTRLREVYIRARQYYYRWTNRIDPASRGAHKGQYMYAVGNGGFSLRRVKAMRSVLKRMATTVNEYCAEDGKVHHEDLFFSIEANRYLPRVKVPSFREAAGFAWEMFPATAQQLNQGRLPFGCHAWQKLHPEEWRPIFSGLGISLDALVKPAAATAQTSGSIAT